ncbi:MAG: hypothetical protein ABNH26_02870 [Celeribacter sp.]|jgi:hypothetical protein
MFAKHILRPVTGAALALAVAMTSLGASAVPAAALTSDELIRLMAGAAIAQSADRAWQERQDERRTWQQDRRPVHQTGRDTHNTKHGNDYKRWDRDDRRGHPVTPARSSKVLPASCRVAFDTRSGTRRYFTERCLERQTNIRALPQQCLRYVRLNRGTLRAYEQNCMKARGYKVKG